MKIGITGAHGTGKTTLMNAFVKRHPEFKRITEVARDCPFPINEGTTDKAQRWILHEMINRELGAYPNDMITDRTTLDSWAYTKRATMKGTIKEETSMEIGRIAMPWMLTYDYVFYVPIEFELKQDGVRSVDRLFQKDIDSYMRVGYDRKMFPVHGSIEDRVEQIEKRVWGI
jgi:predicted ATPase